MFSSATSSLVLSSLVPSSLVPSSLVPSSLVPSSLVPSSLVPSSLVPSSTNLTIRFLETGTLIREWGLGIVYWPSAADVYYVVCSYLEARAGVTSNFDWLCISVSMTLWPHVHLSTVCPAHLSMSPLHVLLNPLVPVWYRQIIIPRAHISHCMLHLSGFQGTLSQMYSALTPCTLHAC